MPLYKFKHKQTGEIHSQVLKMSDLDDFLTNHPELQQCLNAPKLVDPFSVGRVKHDNGFNDLLKETKKAHRGSNINTN